MKTKEEIKKFKNTWNRKDKVGSGKKRQFVKCKECGELSYYDFIPYSLSMPIISTNCGHDFRFSYKHI